MSEHRVVFKDFVNTIRQRRRVKAENFDIIVPDLNHIQLRDFFEVYLKIFYNREVCWSDGHASMQQNSLIKNVYHILIGLFMVPPTLIKVWTTVFSLKKLSPHYFPVLSPHKVIYLRTDHWFNLTFGGSVGHTAGVVNSLHKGQILKHLISSDYLFGISKEVEQIIVSPNYTFAGNVPDYPALDYNCKLEAIIKRQKYIDDGTLIYQRYSIGNYTGVRLKYLYNVPLVLEYNGSEVWVSEHWGGRKLFFFSLYRAVEMINLKHADLIVVVSDALRQELIKSNIPDQRILVNPNGVNDRNYTPELSGDEIRNKFALNGKFVFGFIGTFSTWHGVELLCKVIVNFFKKYPKENARVRFLLIGEGPLWRTCKEYILQSPCSDYVIFSGKVIQDEAPSYLAACDAYLSPHIPNSDGSEFFGSPTKLFEYMAMGKPIIASALGQIAEILEHGEDAWLVEPADEQALLEGIVHLLNDDELRQKLGQGALRKVKEKYTWQRHVENILHKAEIIGQITVE